jgi:hypothetical protein
MLDRRDQPAGIKSEFVDEVSAPKLQSQTRFENFAQALPRRPAVTYTRRNKIDALDGNSFRQPRIKTEAIALRADERPAKRDSSEPPIFSPISCDCKRFRRHFVPASGCRVAREMGGSALGSKFWSIRQDAQDAFARIGIADMLGFFE